ncbi:hypothetical protein [Nocardia alba]|uniref:hypothetical protein n=1 Tax=Nocardia alba TaxID=225051 RepID=UPI0010430688|nr:hypothetical protein [Nocardia alba]
MFEDDVNDYIRTRTQSNRRTRANLPGSIDHQITLLHAILGSPEGEAPSTFNDLNSAADYKKSIVAVLSQITGLTYPIPRDRDSLVAVLNDQRNKNAYDIAKRGQINELIRLTVKYIQYRDTGPKRFPQLLGEEVGMKFARLRMKQMGARIIYEGEGANALDLVAVLDGRLIVVEAKGGSGKTDFAWVRDEKNQWHYVKQGSRLYLEYKLAQDYKFQRALANDPELSHILVSLWRKEANVEYYLAEAPYKSKPVRGFKVLGEPKWSRFDIGDDPVGFFRPPRGGASEPKPAVPPKKAPSSTPTTANAIAGVTLGGLGAIAGVGFALRDSPKPSPEVVQAAVVAPLTGQSPGDGVVQPENGAQPGQFVDGILPGLKATIAEFSRMATSFTSYVQNGLNDLAVMVGGAVAAASGFVTDVIDSAGAQKIIDEISDDWAFAQELLNIAMLFSPVGTVAAAISAAVPIIQLIVEHWDQIRAAFDWVLKNVLTPVAEFFMTAFKIYITPYRAAFNAVMAGFNGMGGVVGTAVGTVRSTVVGIVKAIGQIFQRLEINIGFPVNKSFGLKSIGDAMVDWASERMADGGLVGGQRGSAPRRASGIEVMAVIDRSVLRAAQAEDRKIGYAYRPPFLHDGALPRTDSGPGPRTFDVRVADVDAAFAQIRILQAVQDARISPVGV